jgi:RNA polymerase sigma-70 factor (ECF subfamily)
MPTAEQFASWCRRLRASDRAAYEAVFRATHDALVGYARSLTRDAAQARDLVQDVFVKLWTMRARLDPTQSLEALLYRMTRNLAYNRLRDRRTRAATREALQPHETPAYARPDAPDDALAAGDLDTRLRGWIDALPERQREALTLTRYQGLSHDEVAGVMGISPRTVNNHLVRALRTLRNHLRAYDPDLLRD